MVSSTKLATKTIIQVSLVLQLSYCSYGFSRPCGFPGTPAFGNVKPDKNIYPPGSVVTYSCRVGYILLGSPINRCEDSGEWTEDVPLCDDSMTTLGVAFSTPTVPGHPAELAIDRDKGTCAYLVAKTPRWWRIDLGGNFKILSVAITMISPEKHANFAVFVIQIEGSNAFYKQCASFIGKFGTSTVVLSCEEGKGIEGQQVHVEDYVLEGFFDICEVEVQVEKDSGYECGRPSRNPHSVTFEPEDDEVEYACNVGYELEGISKRTCTATGQWTGEPPLCNEIVCDVLPPLENGYMKLSISNEDDAVLEGSVANYNCDEGYKLLGDFSRICRDDGSWSGSAPKCEAIRCSIPDGRKLGGAYRFLNRTRTLMGSMAILKCKKGKMEGDNPYITCTEEGEWTSPQATCLIPATVYATDSVEYIIVNKEAIVFGMVVAALMMLTVFVSLYIVYRRRQEANKPELPSRQMGMVDAPPRPPPRGFRGKGQTAILLDTDEETKSPWAFGSKSSTKRNEIEETDSSPFITQSLPESNEEEEEPSMDEVVPEKDTKAVEDTENYVKLQSNGVPGTKTGASPEVSTNKMYAAVDYDKKRDSRLLKELSSEDIDTKPGIKNEKAVNDENPPSLSPKKDYSSTKNRRRKKSKEEEIEQTYQKNVETPTEENPETDEKSTTKRTRRRRGQQDEKLQDA